MSDAFSKWVVILGYTALLFVLVRPRSQGPAFVNAIGSAMSNLVKASTGGGSF